MAQVTLRINGYAYTVGCRDGEEQHLHAMASQVEKRIEKIKSTAGSGESRMLVMAALLMADDLYEMEQKLHAAEARAQSAPALIDPKLGRRLSRMAKRAEEIAAGLEAH